jgi:DNA-binding transcriptional LysR family regulator
LAGAAKSVGLTQPTMGRRLRALEQALGQTLFQRGSGGFLLTDEGQAILPHAERMEEEALALARRSAGGSALSGLVRVTASDWFGAHVLAPLFARFTAEHPGITIELLTDQRRYSLARREADLAFRIAPFDEPDILRRRLLRIDYALYSVGDAPPGEGGAGDAFVTMDTAFGDFPDLAWLKRRFPKGRIALRSNNRDVQAQAALAGAGFAVLPIPLGDRISGLRRLDLADGPPGRDLWLGYHRDLRNVARLRHLIDFVAAQLR